MDSRVREVQRRGGEQKSRGEDGEEERRRGETK